MPINTNRSCGASPRKHPYFGIEYVLLLLPAGFLFSQCVTALLLMKHADGKRCCSGGVAVCQLQLQICLVNVMNTLFFSLFFLLVFNEISENKTNILSFYLMKFSCFMLQVSLAVFNGVLLAIGGHDGDSDLKSIDIYDHETNSWR